jgi:transcriptional regulator with PAS, ATPase and Fis domain
VFLDEIGEMVPALQSKLLRFLEEKTFKRVGGSTDIRVDVRVIAATNRNLDDEVQKSKFREDLYYRLKVLPLFLPPLRDRTGDIPLLVRYYVDTFNREFKKNVRGLTADAMRALESHAWPGNIRELRNAIERAMLLSDANELTAADFSITMGGGPMSQEFKLPPGGIRLDELERSLVEQALARARGNQTRAATLLGLNRDQVRYRIEKFGITKAEPATTGSD